VILSRPRDAAACSIIARQSSAVQWPVCGVSGAVQSAQGSAVQCMVHGVRLLVVATGEVSGVVQSVQGRAACSAGGVQCIVSSVSAL
jgi:hypothetical protein